MNDQPAAFKAVFHNVKLIHGRKVVQWIFETPLEQYDQGYQVLGVPNPAESKWVAIALLKPDWP